MQRRELVTQLSHLIAAVADPLKQTAAVFSELLLKSREGAALLHFIAALGPAADLDKRLLGGERDIERLMSISNIEIIK